MTVTATSPLVNRVYAGPGVYTFPFLAYDANDVVVIHTNALGEVQTLTTGEYSVSLNAPNDGGTVNITSVDYGTSGTLTLRRQLVIEQETEWENNDSFDMAILERAFDEVIMMMQQIEVFARDAIASVTWKGDWSTGILYSERDIVEGPDTNWYTCAVAHTANVFANDLQAGYWLLVLDLEQVQDLTDQAAASAATAQSAAVDADADRVAAEAAKSEAEVAKTNAQTAAANALVYQQNAANCSQDASDSADDAAAIVATIDTPTIVRKTADTGAAALPSGTQAQRPGSPLNGHTRVNLDTKLLEVYIDGSWKPAGQGATGAVNNPVFYENDINVTGNYTITSGKNAMSAGPITVNNGVAVTVPDGSVWTVV